MFQLIILIVAIIWALRKPRLRKLTPSQFPGVPEYVFYEWKALELESINAFLWATWGMFLLSIPVAVIVYLAFPSTEKILNLLFLVVFIAALYLADRRGKRVAQFKKQHGIQWPSKG